MSYYRKYSDKFSLRNFTVEAGKLYRVPVIEHDRPPIQKYDIVNDQLVSYPIGELIGKEIILATGEWFCYQPDFVKTFDPEAYVRYVKFLHEEQMFVLDEVDVDRLVKAG